MAKPPRKERYKITELEKQTFDKAKALIEKNKQIEEIAEILCRYKADDGTCIVTLSECDHNCAYIQYGATFYNKGYRKSTDVAREIFEEIEKFNRRPIPESKAVYVIKESEFAELKNKYTEEGKCR